MPNDARLDDPETLKAMLLAERVQNERLPQIIKELQRHRFGRRPETLPEDQVLLGPEEVEQAEANRAAETDGALPSERRARAHKRRINRRALPGHLPRLIEAVCRPRRRLPRFWCPNMPTICRFIARPDLRRPRDRSGSVDAGRLGRSCRLAPLSAA